jgi:hypothetical protein
MDGICLAFNQNTFCADMRTSSSFCEPQITVAAVAAREHNVVLMPQMVGCLICYEDLLTRPAANSSLVHYSWSQQKQHK